MSYILHPGTEYQVSTVVGEMSPSFFTTLAVDAPDDYFSWTIAMPVVATPGGLVYSSGYHFVITVDGASRERSPLEQDAWQVFEAALVAAVGERAHITDYIYENPMKGMLEAAMGHSVATTPEEFEEGGELLPAGVTLSGAGDTIILGPFPDRYRFVYENQILPAFRKAMQPLIEANVINFYSVQPIGMPKFEQFVQSEMGEAERLSEEQIMVREVGKLKNLIETALGGYPALRERYLEVVNVYPAHRDIPAKPDPGIDLTTSTYADQLFADDWLGFKAMLAFDDQTLSLLEEVSKLPREDWDVVQDALGWILDFERWEKLISETRAGLFVLLRPSQMTKAREGLKQVGLGAYVDVYDSALTEGIENLLSIFPPGALPEFEEMMEEFMHQREPGTLSYEDAQSILRYEVLPIYEAYDLPLPVQQSLDQLAAQAEEKKQAVIRERLEIRRLSSLNARFWNQDFAYGNLSVVSVELYDAPSGAVEESSSGPDLNEEEFVREAEHLHGSVDYDDIREGALHEAHEQLTEEAHGTIDPPPSALYGDDPDEVADELDDDLGNDWLLNYAPADHPLVIEYRRLSDSDDEAFGRLVRLTRQNQKLISDDWFPNDDPVIEYRRLSEEESVDDAFAGVVKLALQDQRLLDAFIEWRKESLERDEYGWYDPDDTDLYERMDEIVAKEMMKEAWPGGLVTLGIDYDHNVLEVTYSSTFAEEARKLIGEVVRANILSYAEYEYEGKEAPFDRGSNWKVRIYEIPEEGDLVQAEVPMLEVGKSFS